jgi:hypothetical protein
VERGRRAGGYDGVPSTLTLSVLAGLTVAGAAAGVTLGHSAIAEINPAYFREPETRFHSALAPNISQDWDQVQAHEYDAAAGATQCVGCASGPVPDYPVTYVPGRDPYVDTAAVTRWPAAPRPAAAAVRQETQIVYVDSPAVPDPAQERIVRYASYPVTEDEARAMAERDSQADVKASAPAAQEVAATQ